MIAALLSHYWAADELIGARERQVEDWIEDLFEYPLHVIEGACREWRRRPGNRRPLPGDIRALCMEVHGAELDASRTGETWDEVEIMRRADSYARSHNFADIADFQRAGHSAVMWLPGGKRRHFPANKPHEHSDFSRSQPRPKEFTLTERELSTRTQWAHDHGYQDWEGFLDAVQEGKESVLPYLDWYKAEFAPPPVKGFKTPAQALNHEPPKEERPS